MPQKFTVGFFGFLNPGWDPEEGRYQEKDIIPGHNTRTSRFVEGFDVEWNKIGQDFRENKNWSQMCCIMIYNLA